MTARNESIDSPVKGIVSANDVLTVAQTVVGDSSVKVLDYRVSSYSEEKIGFLGAHRNLEIVVKSSTGKALDTLHLFVKSIPYECSSQADYITKHKVFVKERAFYENIVPFITENYKGERWSPTCYLATKDALIMEDLRYQGYKMFDSLFDDLEILKSAAATLARFHSCSFLTEARLKHESKNTALNEYYPDSFIEGNFDRNGKSSRWCSAGVEVAAAVAEQLGYDSRKLRISFEKMYDLAEPSSRYRNVISHGDLWRNNLMFDNSSPRKCVFVDFQIVRYTPVALDILQLLYSNTTRLFRKKIQNDLVEFYHSVLDETIRNNDTIGTVEIPSPEDIKTQIEDLHIFGPVIAALYFPLIFLDSKIAKQHTEDPEKYEKFIFGNRTDVVLAYMKENEFYRKIIEETVTELVEMSDRIEI